MSEEREALTDKELAWLARNPLRTLRRAATEIQTLRAALGTTGLPLFATRSAPTPPSVPCPTSEAAARGVEATGKAARDRAIILAYLRSRPDGATEAEIATATGLSGDCVRPRVRELGHGFGTGPHATRGMGLIRRTERTRRIPGHRLSLIWEAV